MNELLHVHESTCIRCGKCVKICPSEIFTQAKAGDPIGLQDISHCIVCGHCVAVCPTDSVVHPDFPADKVHPIDASALPSPESVLLLCRSRRSNRAFSSQPIPLEYLEQIVEAAHRAPTASNKQEVGFTLITDPQKLKEVTDITVSTLSALIKTLENPFLKPLIRMFIPDGYHYLPTFHRLENAHARGKDLILRGATALLLIHTPRKSRFGCADANLAYQNASLMAEALGVNQFYTGFVCSALAQDRKHRLEKALGIDEQIHAGMALGMPLFRFPNYIDKKEIRIKRW